MNVIEETYDAIVVGAGHAGCEAALALARLGQETILFTVSMDSVAMMPCNPNIGGSSKGHLVREVDALGGEMGKNIDKTYIQSKMLNKSKGPAVHSLRAQADKAEYTRQMRMTMENTEHLTLRQAEVTELLFEGSEAWQNEEKTVIDDIVSYDIDEEKINVFQGKNRQKIRGVRTRSGASYYAKCVILCTGVYLKARCIYGCLLYTSPSPRDTR